MQMQVHLLIQGEEITLSSIDVLYDLPHLSTAIKEHNEHVFPIVKDNLLPLHLWRLMLALYEKHDENERKAKLFLPSISLAETCKGFIRECSIVDLLHLAQCLDKWGSSEMLHVVLSSLLWKCITHKNIAQLHRTVALFNNQLVPSIEQKDEFIRLYFQDYHRTLSIVEAIFDAYSLRNVPHKYCIPMPDTNVWAAGNTLLLLNKGRLYHREGEEAFQVCYSTTYGGEILSVAPCEKDYLLLSSQHLFLKTRGPFAQLQMKHISAIWTDGKDTYLVRKKDSLFLYTAKQGKVRVVNLHEEHVFISAALTEKQLTILASDGTIYRSCDTDPSYRQVVWRLGEKPPEKPVSLIASGYADRLFILAESGTIYEYSRKVWQKVPLDKKVRRIASCGDDIYFAITVDGELYAWGWDYYRMGRGQNDESQIYTETPMKLLIEGATRIDAVAANTNSTIVCADGGTFYVTGRNYSRHFTALKL